MTNRKNYNLTITEKKIYNDIVQLNVLNIKGFIIHVLFDDLLFYRNMSMQSY